MGDRLQRVVAEFEDGGLVLADRVVEGELVVAKPEVSCRDFGRRASPWRASTSSAMISAVVSARFVYRWIASSSMLGELAGLDDVASADACGSRSLRSRFRSSICRFGRSIRRQPFEELVGQDRQVGPVHAGCGVDVDDLVGRDRLGHELGDRGVDLAGAAATAAVSALACRASTIAARTSAKS